MIEEAANTTISVVSKIAGAIGSVQPGSLVEYTKSTRVEPIVMLDSSLRAEPYMTDVMETLTSIFAGYYLQAVAVLTQVDGVTVKRQLDRLSTDRNRGEAILGALESISHAYEFGLPNYDKQTIGEIGVELLPATEDRNERKNSRIPDLQDIPNLAVGKLFEVTLGTGKNVVEVPVSIRLNVKSIGNAALVHILTASVKDNSAKERFHRWRSGELEFIKDLILCQDLIDNRRKAMLDDKTGTLERLERRHGKNKVAALFSGESSINDASGVVVISSETAKRIESELGKKLSRFKTREELFKNAFVMLMVVVDTEWERVTIYHRSIEDASELDVKDLAKVNRRTGPDVMELLKAFQAGSAPRL